MGPLAEFIRTQKNSIRNLHPYWSISALGKNAKILNKLKTKLKMGKHLTYRSGNPVLTSNAFNTTAISSETMTINGTVNKTFLSLTLLMVTGYYTFMSGQIMSGFAIFSLIAAFIVAIITMYKKEWSPITVPIYAILEGIGLGWFSYSFNSLFVITSDVVIV